MIWTWLSHHTHQTNATFWRPATLQTHPRELRPWVWHWLAGYQRMLIKVGTFLVLIGTLIGWFEYRRTTEIILIAIVLVTAGAGGRTAFRRFQRRAHTRNVVQPLHETLGHALGHYPKHAADWVSVPLDYRHEDTAGTHIQLPAGVPITAELQAKTAEVLRQKLDMSALNISWHLAGAEPYLVCRPEPQAPRAVAFRDMAEHFRNSSETMIPVGLARRNSLVALDLDDDSPHVLISAGSGGGKSVLTKAIIGHALRHRCRVVVLDRKRISHKWARDRVEYHRDVEDIHKALIMLAEEGDRRNRLTDDHDEPDMGARVFVIFEEMNATVGKLRAHWEDIREKGDPKSSPAVAALGDLVNMGRQVEMHVVAIGQRIEARTLGGGDVRESFGIRCLARMTVQTWKMLVPELRWPGKPSIRGRWFICAAGEAVETQVVFLSDTDACTLADLADIAETVGVGTDLVTLPDAFGDAYERLRKAAQRATDFPTPEVAVTGGANLYRRTAIESWLAQREPAGKAA